MKKRVLHFFIRLPDWAPPSWAWGVFSMDIRGATTHCRTIFLANLEAVVPILGGEFFENDWWVLIILIIYPGAFIMAKINHWLLTNFHHFWRLMGLIGGPNLFYCCRIFPLKWWAPMMIGVMENQEIHHFFHFLCEPSPVTDPGISITFPVPFPGLKIQIW